jgi:hypothetical protein
LDAAVKPVREKVDALRKKIAGVADAQQMSVSRDGLRRELETEWRDGLGRRRGYHTWVRGSRRVW